MPIQDFFPDGNERRNNFGEPMRSAKFIDSIEVSLLAENRVGLLAEPRKICCKITFECITENMDNKN